MDLTQSIVFFYYDIGVDLLLAKKHAAAALSG
jgi:hypothetical protein